ncbi:hypothetical protein [Paratractidigestivibacter sp.]|nr:hypothetical protein [Paratractidigestivibacter sp.]
MNELLALGMRPYVLWRQQYQSMRYMDELFDHQIRAELGLRTPRPTHARAAVELTRRRALLAELNAIDGTRWGASQKGRTVQSALEEVERAEWELKQAEGR